ncbi:NAD(+) diphosphatase [Corallincola luteus]|uniref:NAD(+) diphosphatase n=1 Tax=Corallincola luteus TaxID=1775177 RepID=A0ABY2ARN2_9GAMM|nr:NAD(+) diphosphatase [Corallincola luteus]
MYTFPEFHRVVYITSSLPKEQATLSHYQTDPSNPKQSVWFIVFGQKILLTSNGDLPSALPSAISDDKLESMVLGELQGRSCHMVVLEQDTAFAQAEMVDLRSLAERLPAEQFAMAGKACQWETFLNNHRFCGRCGARMRQVQWELAMHCDHCKHRCYPRLSPCIIVAVRRDRQILLAQNKRHKSGVYSVVAGFIEPGETVEQAVHRELAEEVGIAVTGLTYRASQPWPFPHALMMAFTADYLAGDLVLEQKEISDAGWYAITEREVWPPLPDDYTVARQLIEQLIEDIEQND